MIAPTPFFSNRGAHVQILEQVNALIKKGHIVRICTYGLGKNPLGLDIQRIPNFPWYKKTSAGPAFTKILYIPLMVVQYINNVRTFKPDVIHAHMAEGAVIAKCAQPFVKNGIVFYDHQGSLTQECIQHKFIKATGIRFQLIKALEKRILGWYPIITQSQKMCDEIFRINTRAIVSNVRDGVDTEIFRPKKRNIQMILDLGFNPELPIGIYTGLLSEYQGLSLLIESISLLIKNGTKIQVIIIGYPDVKKYSELAGSFGIQDHIRFLGEIDYKELPHYLNLANFAFAPKISLTEGDGKIYNYMATGIPVIAFDRPVSREILGDFGVFAPILDVQGFANGVETLIRDKELSNFIGKQLRLRALSELSWDSVAARILQVYANEISKRDLKDTKYE